MGVPKDRIFAMGMKDNFWQMGDTGPCGPCSEIHYDMGVAASDAGHTDCKFPCECGRYVEIWNLVFMQYDREAGTTPGVGAWSKFHLLPKPSVDTGAGLERVTSVLQGVISNYDTDLFVPLIQRAAELTGTKQLDEELKREDMEEQHHQAASLRVIADHARAATFLISDGVLPMNEGRGYVLRKIIRRAIRHGRLLGAEKPFLFEMVFAVRDMMKDAYPELIESATRVSETIKGEETRFAHTLDEGLKRLDQDLYQTVTESLDEGPKQLNQELAQVVADELLKLGDAEAAIADKSLQDQDMRPRCSVSPGRGAEAHSGLNTAAGVNALRAVNKVAKYPARRRSNSTTRLACPAISSKTRAAMQGITFDSAGFDAAMEEQRKRAQASWKGGGEANRIPCLPGSAEGRDPYAGQGGVLPAAHDPYKPSFVGYNTLRHKTKVIAVFWVDPDTGVDLPRSSAIPGHIGELCLNTRRSMRCGRPGRRIGWLFSEDGNKLSADVVGVTCLSQG